MSFLLNPFDTGDKSTVESMEADDHSPRLNVGSMIDHLSGRYVEGHHGEMILNGGLPYISGVIGGPNQFKSTFSDYMSITAQERYFDATNTFIVDTEGSKEYAGYAGRARLTAPRVFDSIMQRLNNSGPKDGRIFLTNLYKCFGNEYWEMRRKYGEQKLKTKGVMLTTPLPAEKDFMKIPAPTIEAIDSWSYLSFEEIDNKFGSNEVDSKDNNMMFMNDGKFKTFIMMQMPRRNGMDGFYSLLTAHVGDRYQIDPKQPLRKILQGLENNKAIKGATEKFRFNTNNLWYCYSQAPLTDGSGISIYGRGEAASKEDRDLVSVKIINLRGKFGASLVPTDFVFSQTEGHLPQITQLNWLRQSEKYYGMDSNTTNMSLAIYPDVKFTRNSAMEKFNTDPMLSRAVDLTACWGQIRKHFWYLPDYIKLTPQEIFERVKERGYDWDEILGNTRSYWQFQEIKEEKQFLSPLDIMRMAVGEYHPYWMQEKKK